MERIGRRLPALALALALALAACGGGESWQEQYDLGVRYLSEGNYEEAILAFTAAIEIDPNQAGAYSGRGDAYIGSGETREHLAAALADYEAALEQDGALASAWLGLTDVYIRMGDYDTALEVIREAAEQTDGAPEVLAKLEEMENGIFKDSSGRIRQESTYDASGALLWRFTYTYDALGRQASVTSYDGAGAQTGHVDLAYDEAGDQVVSYALSTAVLRVDVAYDGQGRPVERTLYDEAGQVTEIARTTYDEAGREASEERYDPDGTLWSALTWEYDDQDRIVRQNDYRDGALAIYDVYEYDAQGRRVQASYYDGPTGALLDYEVYRYDEAGNYLGSETYDADGSLRSTTVNE